MKVERFIAQLWWAWPGTIRQPIDYESNALPIELQARKSVCPITLPRDFSLSVENLLEGQIWHATSDSNTEPAILETAALPVELMTYYLVGAVGFEPTTYWLKANCSAIELYTLILLIYTDSNSLPVRSLFMKKLMT